MKETKIALGTWSWGSGAGCGCGRALTASNTPWAVRRRKKQVSSGYFPLMLHKKIRKYTKYSRIFLFCLNEKYLT